LKKLLVWFRLNFNVKVTFIKFSRGMLKYSTEVKLEYESEEKCSISKENSLAAAQPTVNGEGERERERERERCIQ